MTDPARESNHKHCWQLADWLGVAVFSAAGLSAGLWLMSLGRDLTFFYDEWDFIEASATSGFWHNVLQPHNGHPSMIPFSVYELLLHTVGLRHYWPYRLVLVLLDIGCGWLLFVLLRRKIHPLAAAAAAAVLMLLGPAWQDLLWPFQIGFLGSTAAGLGALALLDRDTPLADVGACACLVASVASSGVGLPFLAGVAVELAWGSQSWRRLWVPGLPLGLFMAWYEIIGKSLASSVSPVTVFHSMTSNTATTAGAIVGGGTAAGAALSALLAALIIVALVRSPGRVARLAMAVTGLGTFWLLILLARGGSQTSAGRYLYPAAVFVLIAAGELPALITRKRKARLPGGAPTWVRMTAASAIAGIVVYAGIAIWWNSSKLTTGSARLAVVASQVRPELGAIVLAGSALPENFQPDQTLIPQVTVGPYLKAVREFGPSGATAQAVRHPDNPVGANLDAMLLRGQPMKISSALEPRILTPGEQCTQSPIGSTEPTVTFRLPPVGALITSPVGTNLAVRVRGLAAAFPVQPFAIIKAGSTRFLTWSARSTALRWVVELTPSPSPAPTGSTATVCRPPQS